LPPIQPGLVSAPGTLQLLDNTQLPNDDPPLYLDVIVNQVATGHLLAVLQRNEQLYVHPDHLARIGLLLDNLTTDAPVHLDSIPELAYHYDVPQQRLYLQVAPQHLSRALQVHRPTLDHSPRAQISPGALLNYDIHLNIDNGGHRHLAATTALRAFAGRHILESTGLSRTDNRHNSKAYTRLDTQWIWSSQDDLVTVTTGDFISGSLSWTRATRLGGLQVRRNFALQPELITHPLPAFFGEAALPSQVELYIEGLRQYSTDVLPGPYRIEGHPAISGLGQAQVVITDALGRSSVYDFAFYSAPRLLHQGLTDYSLQLGSVRRRYGIDSFSYRGDPAASANLRHGLTNNLTLEVHAEGDNRLAAIGGGVLFTAGRAGTFSGAWMQSSGRQADGGQLALGYNWSKPGVTFDYSLQRTYRRYRDIASAESRPAPARTERLLLGLGSRSRGNLSLHYSRLDPAPHNGAITERQRTVGMSYHWRALPMMTLFASANRALDQNRGYSLHAGFSVSLGDRLSGGGTFNRQHDGDQRYSAHLRRGLPADGGTGWGLQTQQGDRTDYLQADITHRGDYLQAGAGLRSLPSGDSVFGDLSGSLVWMAGSPRNLYPARQVTDGFALVSTNGIADVPVKLENRPIGNTNRRGHYLLTGLGAYRSNRIAIDPLHLPADVQYDSHQAIAVPGQRAGTFVEFGLRQVRAALLILHDARGQPLPLSSRIIHPDGRPLTTVGHDGQAYLEGLTMDNNIRVIRPDMPPCTVRFTLSLDTGDIPVIGPLICRE